MRRTPETLKLAERGHSRPVDSRERGSGSGPGSVAIAGHGGKCQRSESDIGLQRFRIQSAIIESAGASWQN
jgi:hypothetical protein